MVVFFCFAVPVSTCSYISAMLFQSKSKFKIFVLNIHFSTVPEQDERTRESTEQWREFHYDGLDPSYEYNRHTV